MINGEKLLALIPARGGSKRLPRKNILDLAGKPLIAWTIDSALKSKYIDRIVVSTDDEEISYISMKYGADVPFIRPPELSDDKTPTVDVFIHAINKLKKQGNSYKYAVILQPTSPMRKSNHIDDVVELFFNKNVDGIISVTEVGHPLEWANALPHDLSMDNFIMDKFSGKRSQDFRKQYLINGAIYMLSVDRVARERKIIFPTKCYAYIMKQSDSIDIDTEHDYNVSNLILKSNLKTENM